ncbi:MAG: DUF1573 domain-containing protein [Bacteroidia bacterium]|jgi:hypothetical protein|nr:DUF1573 domain-containing protein [Bacteroidia bacterium]
MKKLILLAVLAFGVSAPALAQAPSTPTMDRPTAPVMTFDQLEYNFGTIKQGESVTHEFRFRNTGKEPLIINNAQGSCGCTVPEYPKEPIKPNGTGIIKVTFNSAGKSSIQDKTVTITYDTDKIIVLHMKGTVEAPAPAPAATPVPAPAATPKGTTAPATTKAAPVPAAAPKATPPVMPKATPKF